MPTLPRTSKGVLIALGLLAVFVVFLYASTLLTVLVGVLFVTLVLYLLYVVGVRIHRWLTTTTPWKRARTRNRPS